METDEMQRRELSRRSAMAIGMGVTLLAATRTRAQGRAMTPPAATVTAADGRKVQLWTWDATGRTRGVILFSHGALSAPWKYERLLTPWSAAGFRIVAPLHVDSTDHPDHTRYGMVDSWRARLLDMRAVTEFAGAADTIAAGHSYGSLVALTLGGAASVIPPGLQGPLRNTTVRSVVAFSPPGPSPGLVTQAGYATLAVPAIIETGTKDIPFNAKDGNWRVHLTAFDVAPPGDKYAMVLPNVDHYFGGLICKAEVPGPEQPEQLRTAVRLSLDFLKTYGANDPKARRHLQQAVERAELTHK